ncbi:MAG TPA: Yip1 family protein [Nitrososphaerales archaeon]
MKGVRKAPFRDVPNSPPSGSGAASSSSNFIMGTINSAIELVKNPAGFITAHQGDPATRNEIMVKYVAVLALIPLFATLIGNLWYYSLFARFTLVGSFAAYAFVQAVLTYVLDVAAVYVIAIVIRMLAPTFNSTVDEIKSLKLAAYIFTPAFLIAILDIIPPLRGLTFLGVLYGLYILYIGLPIVLATPKDKVVTYVVAVVVATLVVFVVIGVIISLIAVLAFAASFGFF